MKIVHCLNHFFPEHVAGTEIYVASLVKELQQRNMEHVVVVPNFGKDITEEYMVQEIRVLKYAEPSVSDRQLQMGKKTPAGLDVFLGLLKTESPSVVHFHAYTTGSGITLQHIRGVKRMGYKVLFTFHLAGYSCRTGHLMYRDREVCDGKINIRKCTDCVFTAKGLSPFKRKLLLEAGMLAYSMKFDTTSWNSSLGTAIGYPFVIRQTKKDLLELEKACDKLVVLTRWYKRILELNSLAGSTIKCIEQGVPGHLGADVRVPNTGKPLRLVFVGRINRLKGIDLLLEAMRRLDPGKVCLHIYGDYTSDGFGRETKAGSQDLKHVSWKSVVEPGKVREVISGYDVLCLPSLTEMSPLVIREAFAAGVPVLASRIYGNEEQVEDNVNGWLFNFNDSDDLTHKLEMLINKPSLLVEAGRGINAQRSFADVADEYEELYQAILNA